VPPTLRVHRSALENLATSSAQTSLGDTKIEFPSIARPVDSHAGKGLTKLDEPSAVAAYLSGYPSPEFFIAPYIDYRSSDGLFRKYRIVWIDGQPYPVHMAIADDWKLWYYNAGMSLSAAKRDEEALFMTAFEDGFARRHAPALAAIVETFGLEYMGVDCAETPDGRLLVFEAEIAMVAHNMDSPAIYPYKDPQMRKLFASFHEMLKQKAIVNAVSA
jgi:glutathione synthase/RimK-type ligase-like ATP-grasp enzyme